MRGASHKSEKCSKSTNNILEKSFQEVNHCLIGKLVTIFRDLVSILREIVTILGDFVTIFIWKLGSRTSQQVSRNLGPLWQPGVYKDTKVCPFLRAACARMRGNSKQVNLQSRNLLLYQTERVPYWNFLVFEQALGD